MLVNLVVQLLASSIAFCICQKHVHGDKLEVCSAVGATARVRLSQRLVADPSVALQAAHNAGMTIRFRQTIRGKDTTPLFLADQL